MPNKTSPSPVAAGRRTARASATTTSSRPIAAVGGPTTLASDASTPTPSKTRNVTPVNSQVARADGWNGLSPPGNDDPCDMLAAAANATTRETATPSEPTSDQRRRTAFASDPAGTGRPAIGLVKSRRQDVTLGAHREQQLPAARATGDVLIDPQRFGRIELLVRAHHDRQVGGARHREFLSGAVNDRRSRCLARKRSTAT